MKRICKREERRYRGGRPAAGAAACILCISLLLAACGGKVPSETVPSGTESGVSGAQETGDLSEENRQGESKAGSTGEGEEMSEAVENVPSINGVSIKDFTIVASTGRMNAPAKSFQSALKERYGVELSLAKAGEAASGHEIIFDNDPSYGYDDVKVSFQDGNLVFGAGSGFGAEMAYNYFLYEALKEDLDATFPENGSEVWSSSMPDREVYLEDPSKMPVHWQFKWQPEDWMLDWDGKVDVLYARDKDRLFTGTHRGDAICYPENSLEGIISTWAMGADFAEIDIQITKDNVAVLMHDDTLSRMTNYSELKGKGGLPDSPAISDWTYSQLQELNLVMNEYGQMYTTPYKIPTLQEALQVAKGRIFLELDKEENWRYCDLEGVQTSKGSYVVLDDMIETGNVESVLLTFGLTPSEAVKVQKYIYEKTGVACYFMLWVDLMGGAPLENIVSGLGARTLSNVGILTTTQYNPGLSTMTGKISQLSEDFPEAMLCCYAGNYDVMANYRDTLSGMSQYGLRAVLTNHIFDLLEISAEMKASAEE